MTGYRLGVDFGTTTTVHLARANPAGVEPNPKRRVVDGAVLLAGADVPVTDLIATGGRGRPAGSRRRWWRSRR
ncbi:hypothetical protein GCM10023170_082950 [Phytohabitans houttuyneae]|uniref:Uncharacterized protein n=2 Tax=Phytohabitans houttuyneae TaxID=1076126 RepID=A0A6V8KS28_9ACTN|nr:hypothetical protein Phou_075950 [Phytohabitans houttuyneae]